MACYCSNHLYCHEKLRKIPYELLNERKPNIAYFRVFGCKCYILKKGTKLSKFENKYDEGFLLGYSTTSKAYRVLNLTNSTLEEVHDVEFDKTQGSQNEDQNLDVIGDQLSNAMKNIDIGDIRPRQDDDDGDIHMINQDVQIDTNQASSSGTHDEAQDQSQASESNQLPILQPTSIARDYPLDQIIGEIQSGVQTRSRLASFCEHCSFVSLEEPKKIEDALKDFNWVNTMHEELNNFTRNQVWELVERPKNYNVIGTKWVFRNKQDQDGMVVRNKAKLVAQGYTQVEGLNFGETYAPVARLEAIRILLTYACAHNIKHYQIDVKSAFLNGYINKLVYVEQPPGFEDDKKPDYVYKLKKVLYGLKQVPRAWYERLWDFLLSKGFKMGKVDTTLFTKKLGNDLFVL
jgi:hypothetical protein